MTKTALCLAALIFSASANAGEPRVHTTRDSGSYEVNLRDAGLPVSGGLAWSAPHGGTAAGEPSQYATRPAKEAVSRRIATMATCPPGCRS